MASSSAIVELGGFRVARVLVRSFSVLFRNIGPIGLVALAMLSVPCVLGHVLGIRYTGGSLVDSGPYAWPSGGTLLTAVAGFLVASLQAVLAVGVYETLQGRRPGAGAFIRGGFARLPAALPVILLAGALDALLELVSSVEIHAPWLMAGSMAEAALYLVVEAFIFLAWVFLFVAIPAAAVEGLTLMRSISRSAELVRSALFRVFGLLIATMCILIVVLLAPLEFLDRVGVDPASVPYYVLVWPDLVVSAIVGALGGCRGSRGLPRASHVARRAHSVARSVGHRAAIA